MSDKVSLFATCVLNNFYPEVAISAARVLNRLGVEVTVETSQTCCGQPFQSESAEIINVTYHESCHLNRELGISKEPISLLKSLENINLIYMDQSEVCCGFGGTFSTKYPEISTAMAEEKIANVKQSGAAVVTAADMSCLMHMGGLMIKKNLDIKSLHIAQLMDLAMGTDHIK